MRKEQRRSDKKDLLFTATFFEYERETIDVKSGEVANMDLSSQRADLPAG
jgi:hypothetical protein